MAEFPSRRAAPTATGLKIVGKQTFTRACTQQHVNTRWPTEFTCLHLIHPLLYLPPFYFRCTLGYAAHPPTGIHRVPLHRIPLSLHSFLCQTSGFVCHWVINICRDGIYTAYVNSIKSSTGIFHTEFLRRWRKMVEREKKEKIKIWNESW